MAKVYDPEVIQKRIDAIHAQAAPVRNLREKINLEIEAKKKDSQELSRQIRAIEEPLQELNFELNKARKLAGKQVISLPAG